tara:strand:- start:25284 stop:25748 length:465 start_codon:yes stop_codon:yes gene_type:complete
MRKKLLYTSLIILLIANTVLLYMIVTKAPNNHSPKQNFLIEELHFSENQKDRFLILDREHRHSMRQLDDELRGLRKQLLNSFGKDEFSSDSIANRMGELETSKQKELYSFFSEVRKLCDDNQVEKFDKIIEKVLRQRGPKPPERDKKGPPRENF